MKKNFGFTLAEVLITLGIIGVVAALTAPALVKNSGQAKIGPSLAKFVNTFETACEQMMADEGESQISVSNIHNLDKYMIMSRLDSKITSYAWKGGSIPLTGRSINCDTAVDKEKCKKDKAMLDGWKAYQLKDGMVLIMAPYETIDIGNKAFGAYQGVVANIIIDIDGDKGAQNNVLGKDVFGFYLEKKGILIPVGSNVHKKLELKSIQSVFPSYADVKCDIADTKSSYNSNKNFGCTGVIADNGWKADY